MPMKKKSPTARRARASRGSRLERTLRETQRSLRSAEARLSRRVAALVERGGSEAKQVLRQAAAWRTRVEREGRSARKGFEARLEALKQRARRDRRTLARAADEGVARALAALNIPSRQDLQRLARRVEQLSARVEGLRR